MAIEFKDALIGWMNCGTIGVVDNAVAEPTVDATFRIVEAFDTSSGLNNTVANLAAGVKTLATQDAGIFAADVFVKFEGSNKQFQFAVFINGVESNISIADKATENMSVAPTIELPAGAVLDLRQKTLDGGTVLTVNTAGIALQRLT